ncbi:MAG: class I SAM-dependent methyltransferase [Flavobacteriaceae bacterium]|nr:class I SAM-dependent methyltransferase [Flavobacteriaceae bacterium]
MSYNWDYTNKKTYNNRTGKYKFKREFDFIINENKCDYSSILDIAGGSGRFALPLRRYSKNIVVIDINHTALQLLKQRDDVIKSIEGDFLKIDINEKFSLILCIEALGYFFDLELFFKKISKLLTNNGSLIITYQNPKSWRFLLRKLRHWKKGPYHYNEVEYKVLIDLMGKHNLYVEKAVGMNWIPLPLSSNSRFVSFFEYFENIFRLRNWISQSPWVLMTIKKNTT